VAQIYIICSVRHLPSDLKEKIIKYAVDLKERGHAVRVPFNDTNQDDPIGIRITDEHEWTDILNADWFHIIWSPSSQGSWWDWAQARMLKYFSHNKRILFVDPQTMKPMAEELRPQPPILDSEDHLWKRATSHVLCLTWEADQDGTASRHFLWQLAQARIVARLFNLDICICGAEQIQPTPIKSYDNVALCTHLGLLPDITRDEFDRAVAQFKEKSA